MFTGFAILIKLHLNNSAVHKLVSSSKKPVKVVFTAIHDLLTIFCMTYHFVDLNEDISRTLFMQTYTQKNNILQP